MTITITGTAAGQTTAQNAAIDPFSLVTVTDSLVGPDTAFITVSGGVANGVLSGTGVSTTATPGAYTVTDATPAAFQTDLRNAVFTPTVGAPNTAVTTTLDLSINGINSALVTASPVTSVIDTVAAVAPTITGTHTTATTQNAAVDPFTGVIVGDLNAGSTDTLFIQLTNGGAPTGANGALSGTGLTALGIPGQYDLSDTSAAAITADLDALLFTPATGAPGSIATTGITLTDVSNPSTAGTIDTTTVVTNTVAALPPAPTITGAVAGQTTANNLAIDPFATVVITDPNTPSGILTDFVDITLTAPAGGTLTGTGLTDEGGGAYELVALATVVTAELQAVVFHPATGAPGSATTTTFALQDTSTGAATVSLIDDTTTVINTVAPLPTITGTIAGQTTTNNLPTHPFAGVVITDTGGGTDTVTITPTGGLANGSLSGPFTFAAGSYTVTGTLAAVTADLRNAVFTPTTAPNTAVTTTFGLGVVGSVSGASAPNTTTTVIDTVAAVAPTIAGAHPTSTVQNNAVDPFTGVTVGDTNGGVGVTDTLTITLSGGAGSGTLIGTDVVSAGGGVYTLTGAAAAITTDLQAVSFAPNGKANTAPVTTFALSDLSSAFTNPITNSVTVVTDTVLGPTITGTVAGQRTTNGTPVNPFSGVTVVDSTGGTDLLFVTLSGLGVTGTLSGLGAGLAGVYTLAGTPAAITTELDAATFTPTALGLLSPGSVTPTTFTLTDTSSVAAPTATNSTTTMSNTVPTDSILFQNIDGQAAIWQLNGTDLIGGGGAGANPGPSWTAIGMGDFFGAPGAVPSDILWQNSSGQASIWEMNGTNVIGGGLIGAAAAPTVALNPGPDWKAVGTGDFTGGGTSDILWQNTSTGQASIWEMTGNLVIGGGQVSAAASPTVPLNAGPGWTAVGTGDFNHDGASDILWQNSSTGAVSIWDMTGNLVTGGGQVTEAASPTVAVTPGADWKAVGTGDFFGNGDSDILFQNSTTSQVSVWEIGGAGGTTLIGGGAVATPGMGWQAIGSDGGGSEILLQNTSFFQNASGQTSIWDIADGAITGGGPTSVNAGRSSTAVGLAGHGSLT